MQPAARLGDMHVCPMFDGPKPHVGGPIMPPCQPSVLIGSMPAAVLGDRCVCVGPPDVIVSGCMTVLIGGRPAARLGDPTAHGGLIVAGCPTVLITAAGAPVSMCLAPPKPSLFARLKAWVVEKFSATFDLKSGELEAKLELGALKDWEFDGGRGKVEFGAVEGGAKMSDGKYGLFGAVAGFKAKWEGAVLGNENFGLTLGVNARALAAEGFVGVEDGSFGGTVGATAFAGGGSVGLNILGYNVSLAGEAGLKWEAGLKVGPKTWLRAGPFSAGISFSKAIP